MGQDGKSCAALAELLLSKKCVRDQPAAHKYLRQAVDVCRRFIFRGTDFSFQISKPKCYEGNQGHQCWALASFYQFFTQLQPEEAAAHQADAAKALLW